MSNLYLALIPLFGWALGDFLIQKSSRAMSGARTLFYICVFSTVFLLPFIKWEEFEKLQNYQLVVFTGVLGFFYAIILFQAFKVAKLSIVESIIALELPLTIFLATTFAGEYISKTNMLLLLVIFVGMLLTVSKENIFYRFLNHFKTSKKSLLEKGFYLALASVVLSSVFNFFVGYSGLENSDTILVIWLVHIVLGVCTFLFMLFTKELGQIYYDFKAHPYLIFLASFFDTFAWAGYIYAVSKNNISSVTAVSEGYIALAALMGYYFNKEKLILSQKIGMVIVFACTIVFVLIN